MATVIVDRVTFGQSAIRYILAVGSDPASDGLAAGLGSKAELEDGSAEWRKTGALDTDWVRVDVLEHEASASAHTPANVGAATALHKDDGRIWIDVIEGSYVGGAWNTVYGGGGNPAKRRTASAVNTVWYNSVPLPTRAGAGTGIALLGFVCVYKIITGPVVDAKAVIYAKLMPQDGAAMGAPTAILGNVDAYYDEAHNTAAKRGADNGAGGVRWHTAFYALPEELVEYITGSYGLALQFEVTADPAGISLLDYYGTWLIYRNKLPAS